MTKHYKAHRDWEGVDEITIRQVPRFKTSRLSGDEWRVHAVVTFKRKGKVVYERPFHRIFEAASFLPWLLNCELVDNTTHERGLFGHYEDECAQPGCEAPSVNHYRLKKVYASQGDGPLPYDGEEYRAFCEAHSVRGDCGMEDNDKNYELVKGTGHKTLNPSKVSPPAFGGIIDASESSEK